MSILLIAQNRNLDSLKEEIQKIDSNIDIEIWPAVTNPSRVQFAVAWNHPKSVFEKYPNLKAISSLGAGVDHLFRDESIPGSVRISRIVASSLSDQMSDFVLASVLNLIRNTELYFRQQQRSEWKPERTFLKSEIDVGVMGLGEMGRHAALRLRDNGFRVSGWSRRKKQLEGIQTFEAAEQNEFLSRTNILVCLLPLTPGTEGILDLELFKKLKKPAFVVNAARGEHLVEEDLIYALDTSLISHAVLDVFETEPLPDKHPFWNRKNITITPHIASVTDPSEAAAVIAENYKRLLSGMDLLYEANRNTGY
jgi:glyoxylate/hydroxypyruvate reductase